MTQRRLGRGLEALLGRSYEEPATMTSEAIDPRVTRDEGGQLWLDLAAIERNPYQPRQTFDEAGISELAESIREHGVLQALVVRQIDDRFELIAGERRFRAAQVAGWERVPVQVRDVTDRQMAELAIIENVQRKDLNPIEKGASFQRYLDEYQCTQEELASRLHIDRSTIANLIRLLELPETVKTMVQQGEVTQGHARALLPLGDEGEQIQFAERIKKEGMSVRATEQAVHNHIHQLDGDLLSLIDAEGNRTPVSRPTVNSQVAALEQQLRAALGTKVDLKQTAKGRGRLTIHFKNHDEFDRLMAMLTFTQQQRESA